MVDWIRSAWKFIFRQEKASVAIEGFDRFARRMENRLAKTEKRLDECDEDRAELRAEVGVLKIEVGECKEDRDELRERIKSLEQPAAQ